MKRIFGITLGILFGILSFASSTNAALVLCTPAMAYTDGSPTAAEQQQYAACQKLQQATTTTITTTSSAAVQTKQSTGLTAQQIQAIVVLLQAFGADQAVVARVEAALRNSTVTH